MSEQKTTQRGFTMKTWFSFTLLARILATRKAVFMERYSKEHVALGSNDGPITDMKQMLGEKMHSSHQSVDEWLR